MSTTHKKGYTLIELMVAVGLFALIMTLASGAYLLMIGVSRHTQAEAIGIDNLAFALETMVRTIRTSTDYCAVCNGQSYFSMKNGAKETVTYARSGSGGITQDVNGTTSVLTDPSVTVTSLIFYVSGATKGDAYQPHVTIVVSGTVVSGAGKAEPFTIQTGATMRGTDL